MKQNSIYKVKNFSYNGFMVIGKAGYAPWTIKSFIKWTNDPGIGKFYCSDGKSRLIPSCQLHPSFFKELPKALKLEPLKGNGVLFGKKSSSR